MPGSEIAREQAYVSKLYESLDGLRRRAQERLAEALRADGGTPQALSERDIAVAEYGERLAAYHGAEHGLCFGRLDLPDDERRYIGRLGIFDEAADYEPLLVDWRAAAARPFYLATAAAPDGVRRRRHIRTSGRRVTGLHDEVLDPALAAGQAAAGDDSPDQRGDAALLAALNAGRTGRMSDIVATIQAEQDRIIRSDHHGVLVVEGAPGTGKTAVALHRAAYLLYTHRETLANRGVLVVGPNPTFLRYIDQVLPSLGETGVVLATVDQLFPGITVEGTEPPEVAALKGQAAMAEVVAGAVRDRQEVPDQPREIVLDDTHAWLGYQRETVTLEPADCRRAIDRARQTRRRHNQARATFVKEMQYALARQLVARLGEDPYADDPLGGGDAPGAGASLLDEADVVVTAGQLASDSGVQAALAKLWPVLTPQQLLADLFAAEDRLATACPQLAESQLRLLRRDPQAGWTRADVPLLDEAAELLDEDAAPTTDAGSRQQAEFAEGVLEVAAGSRSIDTEDELDPEVLSVADLLDAEQLAQRHRPADRRTLAERAAADRRWTFGHIIVDEAQELSPMAWRMLLRRCPSRSMTVVGDPAQASEASGVIAWEQALAGHLGDRWRRQRLTVNYRTPAEIMTVATELAAELGVRLDPPQSVRQTGREPWRVWVEAEELADELPRLATSLAARHDSGRVAVIVPAEELGRLGTAVVAGYPAAAIGTDPAGLDAPVVVLTVGQAKGLEFDAVLVVQAQQILAGSGRGANELYVALTRATQELGIVHSGELPPGLVRLTAASRSAAIRG